MTLQKAALACVLALLGFGTVASAAGQETTSFSAKRVKVAPGTQKAFRKSQEAYEAKRYEEAEALLNQLLLKQDDYQPARILLIRVLYQLKKLSDANTVCSQLEIEEIDPDTSYECGQAAFRSNNFNVALPAFKNVPNGHSLYDLAGYYGGISAFKKGDYPTAIDMLGQAVVLPSKLVRSQKLYLKEAEKALIQKQKQDLDPKQEGVSKAPPAEKPYSILTLKKGIGLLPALMSQTYSGKDIEAQTDTFSSTQLRLDLGSLSHSGKGANHFLWRASLGVAAVKNWEKEILITPSPEHLIAFTTARTYAPAESMTTFRMEGAYEWSLGSHSSVGLKLGGFGAIADADFAKRIIYAPYVHLFLAQKSESLSTALAIETYPAFDSDKQLVAETRQLGRISINLPGEFFLNVRGELSEFSYNVEVDGPDWQARMFTDISYGEAEYLAIGGFTELAHGWRTHNLGSFKVVRFDQTSSGIYAKANLPLTSWFTLGGLARAVERSNSNHEPSLASDTVKALYPTSITQFSVYMEIFKSF